MRPVISTVRELSTQNNGFSGEKVEDGFSLSNLKHEFQTLQNHCFQTKHSLLLNQT